MLTCSQSNKRNINSKSQIFQIARQTTMADMHALDWVVRRVRPKLQRDRLTVQRNEGAF